MPPSRLIPSVESRRESVGGSVLAVASSPGQCSTSPGSTSPGSSVPEQNAPPEQPVGTGLESLRQALAALRPGAAGGSRAPVCCTWVCGTVVGDVHDRGQGTPNAELGLEFETVLVRRLGRRYLRAVTDAAAGRPVPRVWQLLLDPPPASPARLALAGVSTLLDHDLTLAFASTCTVLGRDPGSREREAHGHVAALLATCGDQLVRLTGGPADVAAAARLDGPARHEAARRRAESLWTLRGRPAEAEAERDALDREVHAAALRLLAGRP